jgi:alpha-ketoglutarate-dependent taurine dioxygenase
MTLDVRPLESDLPYGARIRGVTADNARDPDVRARLQEVFNGRGMIVFEEMAPTSETQIAVSEVFGPVQEHALDDVPRSSDKTEGIVEFQYSDVFEVNGVELSSYLPWHFDACYVDKLNRGGVLRAIVIAPEGGLTGFADGIQLYRDISPELRDKFENLDILYHSHLMFTNMRFGRPKSYRAVKVRRMITDMLDATKEAPRSVHPAIWTRESGEKVLHVSPWQAAGIEGHETEEGNALLEALCQEIYDTVKPYRHSWKETDMVIWDNWRFIHSVGGHNPEYPRTMRRTTITGDYGLGRMEREGDQQPIGMSV